MANQPPRVGTQSLTYLRPCHSPSASAATAEAHRIVGRGKGKLTEDEERMELRPPAHTSVLLVLLLSCAATPSVVLATKYTVGDGKLWNPGVNYTEWVNEHRPFYVGDWLVFYYTPGMADVVQVDEAAYNKCDVSHPISNYSKGRSYAFELNETKRYYFICSLGYCYQGMKLSIKAEPLPPPSPPPSSKRSAAARTFASGVAALGALMGFLVF